MTMYKKIMVALDGSELAECVLPHVEAIAKGCGSPEVILVQSVEPLSIPYGREISKIKSMEQLQAFEIHQKTDAEKYLKGVVDRLKKAGINARADIIYGKAGESLSDYAAKNNMDLLTIATHGRSGISRWVMGSVADRLLRATCVPVMLIRAPGCIHGI